MAPKLIDVTIEYTKNKNLKKNEVERFLNLVNTEPHLPKITELQAILFLHGCDHREEEARKKVDTFFSFKNQHPDLFKGRNPLKSPLKESLNVTLFTPLPQKTPEGYTIMFLKLMDVNPKNYDCTVQLKLFDMISMLHLHQEGTSEGQIMLFDMKGMTFGHLFRLRPLGLKKFIFYAQEGSPERLRRIHFFNIVPYMDKVMALLKPLMSKEFADLFCLHKTVDDLIKYVPLEFLPQDYGGSMDATSVLHEKIKRRVNENVDFFEWEDEQNVDESKRPRTTRKYF